VSVTDNAVTIKASTEQEQKEEKGDYFRRELTRGTFVRTVALPTEVNGEQAKANFKDGILELTLPKVERAKARHLKIE
jgi:HSP20 family protein